MKVSEYFLRLRDYTEGYLPFDEKLSHVILYTPYMKKVKSFTLLFEGVHFFRLEAMDGVFFYELLKCRIISTRDEFDTLLAEVLDKMTEIYPNMNKDTEKEKILLIYEELKNYALGTHKKNSLRKIYAHTYCDTYYRPSMMKLDIPDTMSLDTFKENLNLLRKNAIAYVIYPDSVMKRPDYREFLKASDGFYKEIELKASLMTPKVCQDLYDCHVDRISFSVYSTDNMTEYKYSRCEYKDILAGIKQAIGHKIAVTAKTVIYPDNENYIQIPEMLHPLGVRDYRISFDKSIKDKDLIVKRAYFYTNINELSLFLDERNIIKEKNLKRMNIIPSYKEYGRTPFLLKENGEVFSPKYNENLGNLLKESIALIYNKKYLKVFRKGKFKEEDYETKNE